MLCTDPTGNGKQPLDDPDIRKQRNCYPLLPESKSTMISEEMSRSILLVGIATIFLLHFRHRHIAHEPCLHDKLVAKVEVELPTNLQDLCLVFEPTLLFRTLITINRHLSRRLHPLPRRHGANFHARQLNLKASRHHKVYLQCH